MHPRVNLMPNRYFFFVNLAVNIQEIVMVIINGKHSFSFYCVLHTDSIACATFYNLSIPKPFIDPNH